MRPIFKIFLVNFYIYYIFSTLRPKSSPGTDGGIRMCYRHPITYQKKHYVDSSKGGGTFCVLNPGLYR